MSKHLPKNVWICEYHWPWWSKYHFLKDGELVFEIRVREHAAEICKALNIDLPSGDSK